MIRHPRLLVPLSLLLLHPAAAQAPLPGAGSPAPAAASYESGTALEMQRRTFDTDKDSVDLEEGTLNWKGRTFNIGNNRVLRARFERYLSSPAVQDENTAYQNTLDDILLKLRPADNQQQLRSGEAAEDNLLEAWKILFIAAENPMDNGTSLLIANMVNNAWRVRDDGNRSARAQAILEGKKSELKDKLSYDWWIKAKKFESIQEDVAKGKHTGYLPSAALGEKDDKAITERGIASAELAEVQARIAALNTQTAASALELKLQFQSQIVQFLMQRRFQHCLISAAFYRQIFRGSHQGLEVGKQQLEELFPKSDLKPTIDALEFLAREAMADVRTGMQSVDNAYVSGELFAALERLQETFFLGEYLPSVTRYEETKKSTLLTLFRINRDIQRLMDLKDYNGIEALVNEGRALAKDYPHAPITSAINTARQASNLALLNAQQAVAMGDIEKARIALTEATSLWPLNPAVSAFSEAMALKADTSSQAAILFDQFYRTNNYRAIYDQKAEFTAGLMRDPVRGEKLKEILERLSQVEILIGHAREMLAQNNPQAALEILYNASEIQPQDPAVSNAIAEATIRVPDFARTLKAAQDNEAQGAYAVSLMQFLRAQELHPGSKYSREGIDRVTRKLMRDLSGENLQMKSSENKNWETPN